ncbi:MAG: hypothetical protein RR131_03880 [Anaerovorax sp.]
MVESDRKMAVARAEPNMDAARTELRVDAVSGYSQITVITAAADGFFAANAAEDVVVNQ